jgi:hypothetical protein
MTQICISTNRVSSVLLEYTLEQKNITWFLSFRACIQPVPKKNILNYGLSDMDMDKPNSKLAEPWTKWKIDMAIYMCFDKVILISFELGLSMSISDRP